MWNVVPLLNLCEGFPVLKDERALDPCGGATGAPQSWEIVHPFLACLCDVPSNDVISTIWNTEMGMYVLVECILYTYIADIENIWWILLVDEISQNMWTKYIPILNALGAVHAE